MKLAKYLSAQDITPNRAAAQVGISQSQLSRFLRGKRGLSLVSALKIEKWSRGQVTMRDLAAEMETRS